MPNNERACRTLVGHRLREARKSSGLDPNYIAEQAFYSSREQIYQYEINCKFSSLMQIARLCKLYGITLDSLVEGLV